MEAKKKKVGFGNGRKISDGGKNENNEKKVLRNFKRAKTLTEGGPSNLNYGEFTSQNEKFCDYMEDQIISINNFNKESHRRLFCVFDGHGGDATAKLCVKRFPEIFAKCLTDNPFDYELAIKQSFNLMDKEIEKIDSLATGNTATVIFINNKLLYCANVGDSSCCIVSNKKGEFITVDDNLTNQKEKDRILKFGTPIIDGRLGGVLAVTRGMGDFDMKKKGLICEPHITKKLIDSSLKYCIIASDGVWDVLTPDDAFKICQELGDPVKISEKLVENAMEKGSEDNISCIVVELNRPSILK